VSVDLRTTYLGLSLRSPFVCSSSPLTGELATAKRLERAGAAALVLPSLFEEEILNEEIQLTRSLEAGAEQHTEARDYFPSIDVLPTVGDLYLRRIARWKEELSIPVIASLNAASTGGWVRYARLIEEAGADALELNLYHLAADPRVTGAQREAIDLELIRAVKASVSIPVAVKLSPYYSALAEFAGSAVAAGADGLVLFNRFFQPDIELETFDVVNKVDLSRPSEMRQPLRWTAILRPQLAPSVSMAVTSGVHSGLDAVKALAVGADVTMMASALLKHGPEFIRTAEQELLEWLESREYESVAQLRGSATREKVDNPEAFERANYVATLHSWTTPPDLLPA
jgi:dihydroorotate dehydrogenase (fumarate)